jgi:hypothetical protein
MVFDGTTCLLHDAFQPSLARVWISTSRLRCAEKMKDSSLSCQIDSTQPMGLLRKAQSLAENCWKLGDEAKPLIHISDALRSRLCELCISSSQILLKILSSMLTRTSNQNVLEQPTFITSPILRQMLEGYPGSEQISLRLFCSFAWVWAELSPRSGSQAIRCCAKPSAHPCTSSSRAIQCRSCERAA